MSLLISDRIKSSLSDQCLRCVLSVENNQVAADTGSWLKPSRLAELVDEYIATVGRGPGTCARATYIGQPQSQLQSQSGSQLQSQSQSQSVEGRNQVNGRGRGAVAANAGNTAGWNDKSQRDFAKPASTAAHFRNVNGRRCTICDSPNHLRAVCPKRTGAPVRVNNTTAIPTDQHSRPPDDEQADTQVTVNRVVIDELPASDYTVDTQTDKWPSAKLADISTERDGESRPKTDTNADEVFDERDDDDVNVENILSLFDECKCSVINEANVRDNVSMTNVQFDMHRFVADSDVSF